MGKWHSLPGEALGGRNPPPEAGRLSIKSLRDHCLVRAPPRSVMHQCVSCTSTQWDGPCTESESRSQSEQTGMSRGRGWGTDRVGYIILRRESKAQQGTLPKATQPTADRGSSPKLRSSKGPRGEPASGGSSKLPGQRTLQPFLFLPSPLPAQVEQHHR